MYSAIFRKVCFVYATVLTYASLFFFKVACKGEIVGENILRRNMKSGFVIAINHVSYLDWLVLVGYFLYYHKTHVTFLAKDKLFHHPIWKYLVIGLQTVRVSDNGTKFLSHSEYKRLFKSKHIGIFPEGARSKTGQITSPHGGAIKIAAKKGLPIIPTRLEGFYEAWPSNKKLPSPRPCKIVFGQECYYKSLDLDGKSEEVLGDCMKELLLTLKQVDIA